MGLGETQQFAGPILRKNKVTKRKYYKEKTWRLTRGS